MHQLLAIITILLSISSFAQKKDTLVRYFNAELEPVRKKEATYVGVAVKDVFGWNAIVYNDSMKVIMRGKYTAEDCKTKDGWFIYYNRNGERYLAGKYSNNKKNDLWLTWYPSGKIRDSIYFYDDRAHGPSRKYFESGFMECTGFYKYGSPDSVWEWYHENGRKATSEKYTKGLLSFFECFDTTGNSMGMNCAITRLPAIKGKYGGLEKYVSDSIRYPEKINLTEISFVTVQFTVDKEGTMSEPRIFNPANKSLSDEVIRVLKSIPGWYPAVLHNRTVTHTYSLNISFFPDGQGVGVQEITNPFQTPGR